MNTNPKNIWIINEYAGSPYHGMEFRHYYLSKELIKLGYHVTIISSTYSHLFKKFPSDNKWFNFEWIDGIQYVWIKVPRYSASQSVGRVLKWFWSTLSLFFLPIRKMTKPDYIIVSPMQTMPVLPTYFLSKKFTAKWIFEVKDIWPLSVIQLGNYSPKHPFIRLLKYFERFALLKTDAVVSVLNNYQEYLNEQQISRKFYYIPNGVDINSTNQFSELDENIKQKIPVDKFIIGYAGTIGKANALGYLIEAARLLNEKKEIMFIIIGDGDQKIFLEERSKDLNNVLFLESIPKKKIHFLLKMFNVCYIGLENLNLFRYGISPNKLFDYMFAAKPILMAISTKNSIIEQANCGIFIDNPNPKNISNSILKLYQMDKKELEQMGKNGKNFVLKNHTFSVLAQKYSELFEELSHSKHTMN